MSAFILRRAGQAAMPGRTVTHPLDTAAVRHTKSLGDACGMHLMGIHLVRVTAGGTSTVKHRHDCADEFIYVLEGSGTILLDDEEHTVGAGDFIGLPAGGPAHALRNTNQMDLVYLIGGNRPDFDVCDYPDMGKRLYLSVAGSERRLDTVAVADVERR